MADPFVSVVGLSDHELPKDANPTGMLALWIRGLCIGGMDVTVGSDKGGWLVLFRNDSSISPDKMSCKFYQEHVQVPFLHGIWKEKDNWQVGDPIPPELSLVWWCNGDLAQIVIIIDETSHAFFEDEHICANKQSAS